MKEDIIWKKLNQILEEELKIDEVSMETSQENTAEWDSMTYLSIVARVEEEFKVEVTPQNIERFSSVKSIVDEILR